MGSVILSGTGKALYKLLERKKGVFLPSDTLCHSLWEKTKALYNWKYFWRLLI